MRIGIVGARGDMGKNFLLPLLSKLSSVCTADRNDIKEKWQDVWQADVIWLSVPRDAIPEILQKVKLSPDQLIVDICSIKRHLSKIISKTGAAHLSLHPLHGPHVPLDGQKWVIIPTDKKSKDHPKTLETLKFLRKQGIHFLDAESEDHHDFMLGITLSIPELLTIILDKIISQYAKDSGQKEPSLDQLMKWAVPASNALLGAYIHSINSSAYWLREDLICRAHGDLVKTAAKTFEELKSISKDDIRKALQEQHEFIKTLPKTERERARYWIERWFVDSTQKIFTLVTDSPVIPKIYLQHSPDIKNIFPSNIKGLTVGIHGIEGCFTHEAALRLCEEINVDVKNLDFKFLVTAENVLKAVVKGEVDRGVFAMANSGSGAYVSSMFAMGRYQYDVLAVFGMTIIQCLLAHPSIKDVSRIKEVFGHPQAVSQCKRTFAEKYPQIKLVYGADSDDTALCAKRIADGDLPKTTATLASQVAAKLYNLNILAYGMHHDPYNTTTFLVIKKKE